MLQIHILRKINKLFFHIQIIFFVLFIFKNQANTSFSFIKRRRYNKSVYNKLIIHTKNILMVYFFITNLFIATFKTKPNLIYEIYHYFILIMEAFS